MSGQSQPDKPVVACNRATPEYAFREGCGITEWWNRAEDGALSVARACVAPGTTTRWHRLRGIAERYVILEGCGRVELDAGEAHTLGPGDVVFIPAGGAQRIHNTGDGDLLFLALCTPRFSAACYEDLEGGEAAPR